MVSAAYQVKFTNHVSFKRINNKDLLKFQFRLKTQTADLYNLSRQQALRDRNINRTHFCEMNTVVFFTFCQSDKCVRISKRVLIETHFYTYGKGSLRRNDLLSLSYYNNEFEAK